MQVGCDGTNENTNTWRLGNMRETGMVGWSGASGRDVVLPAF